MMRFFQRLGKSLMLPVACLPIGGLLMGIGYWIDPSGWGANSLLALLLIKAGGILIDNMAILFALGIAIGMSKDQEGTSALAAIVSWLTVQTMLGVGVVATIMGVDAAEVPAAFSKINNQFIGILCGLIAAWSYNKFYKINMPDFLGFFAGRRFVPVMSVIVSLIACIPLYFVWPVVYGFLVGVGEAILGLGAVGAGIYGFLNRLLIPIGMHHALNSVFWFDVANITYILIMASVMSSHQNRISHPVSVAHMLLHLGLLVGLNLVVSSDMGVSLIFVFIFIGMTFAGGVSLWWFAAAMTGIAAMAPILWQFLDTYQRNRILILFDDSIDPQGINERYHSNMNLKSLTGGGLTGQGLFNGNRTQGGNLFAQHTDYIFSSMGEELGFIGCVVIMLMELAIIARCVYVGVRCQDYMRRLVCFGAASALMFQVMINVGMCIGVMPVIGLTLPLISYGGSSVVTIFAMLGLVSGAYARPQSLSHERYVQPYRG